MSPQDYQYTSQNSQCAFTSVYSLFSCNEWFIWKSGFYLQDGSYSDCKYWAKQSIVNYQKVMPRLNHPSSFSGTFWRAIMKALSFLPLLFTLSSYVSITWTLKYLERKKKNTYGRNHILFFGRVTVLKTLIIPKLNHLFIALPNPSIDTLKSLTKDFFQFIWGSKCDRIKRNVIMQGNIYGGLNMLNLEKFVMSLKCSWIRRIVSGEQAWIGIMNALYGNNIASCIEDFGDDFYTNMIKENKNHFWKDVFLSWQFVCQQQYKMENADTELFKMPIWFNSFIKVNKKSVFIKKWYKQGVKIIGDFFDAHGNLLAKQDFEHKFNIQEICLLQYQGLCSAIKKFIRNCNLDMDSYEASYPYIPFHISCLLKNKKGCKDVYCILNSEVHSPTAISKWNTVFENDPLDWKSIFTVCFKTTKDSSLQWFQYRLIHRIIPVGSYLKKIQIKPTDTCTLCKETVETIIHLFFECEKATYLWNELHYRILDVIHVDVNFTLKTVLFGERSYTCNKPINIILLATKQYLYTCSKKEKNPNIMELLFVLHQKYEVEKLVAYKNLNSRKFTKTWGIWKTFFERCNEIAADANV